PSTSTQRNPRCRRIETRNSDSGIGLCRLSALRRGSFRGLPSGSSDQHRPGDPHVIRLLLRVGDLPRQTHTGAATHLGVRPTGCRFHHPVGWNHTQPAALANVGMYVYAFVAVLPAVFSETIHTSHFCSFHATTPESFPNASRFACGISNSGSPASSRATARSHSASTALSSATSRPDRLYSSIRMSGFGALPRPVAYFFKTVGGTSRYGTSSSWSVRRTTPPSSPIWWALLWRPYAYPSMTAWSKPGRSIRRSHCLYSASRSTPVKVPAARSVPKWSGVIAHPVAVKLRSRARIFIAAASTRSGTRR